MVMVLPEVLHSILSLLPLLIVHHMKGSLISLAVRLLGQHWHHDFPLVLSFYDL